MFKAHTADGTPFVIAEVGQNHQGDLAIAREFIRILAFEGADAIKFQTRDNRHLFATEAFEAPYQSENAFGVTYGLHREQLELRPEWLPILRDDCRRHGIRFMSTPFDEPSLQRLVDVGVDILKVASFDLGNLPLIDRMARTQVPMVLSVGGGQDDQIRASVETVRAHHDQLAVLHCVSEYPCEYHRLGLDNIERLARLFPDCTIGSSDHFNGTLSGPVAYLKGARVFEKHVTLNRAWKGTDHSFALEPDGFRKFVRDVKRVRFMMAPKPADDIGRERVFQKLGKSLIAARDLAEGTTLSLGDLSGRIFLDQHIPVRESNRVLGRRLRRAVPEGQPLHYDDLAE